VKLWLYRHRRGVLLLYIAFAVTVIFVLQVLEAQGVIR
jgi:hypothetical protein